MGGIILFYKKVSNNAESQKEKGQRNHPCLPRGNNSMQTHQWPSQGWALLPKVFGEWPSLDHGMSATGGSLTLPLHNVEEPFKNSRNNKGNSG